MVYADLHVHTTTSDGTLSPEEVPVAARNAGVSVVAVTDHDRLAPAFDAPIVDRDPITIIRGIELRVDPGDDQERIDLLGYAVDPTPALTDELDRLQRDRMERGAAIRDHLEAHLGVDLEVAIQPGVGRPHLAAAVVDHPHTEYTDENAVFADLIGEDGPCYVPRAVTAFEEGVTLLEESCAVVGLAHPLRYEDPETALAHTRNLDAVERYYPYEGSVDHELVDAAIKDHDLLLTGGSDAHDTELGRAGLTRDQYTDLRHAFPRP